MSSPLTPGSFVLAGQSTIPHSGATYPSAQLYPGNSFPAGVSADFWEEPGNWERAEISPASLYYNEFVRPLKHLQGGHIRTPGSWSSLIATNPEAGTIAWSESEGLLMIFDGSFWREFSTNAI